MAGYKDEEIEAAVSRFVQSAIRIEKDALGPVDVGSKFTEVLQLISSTLIYDPNAIFYVIYLATNKLNVAVELAIEYAEDIEDAIEEMGYHTKDVTRTTLLGDAAAALLTVDQILTDKSAISSRAFTRYQQAVDSFIQVSLEPNIKQSGQVVRPPQLARQDALAAISSLSTVYAGILGALVQIRLMLDEFNALSLGVVSIQKSVQKVRDDLRTLQTQFESAATTRDDKIALCREAYLSLASGKAVLNNFTTVTDPSDPRLTSSSAVAGQPAVPTGDEGELIPATITGTRSAPWEVTGIANELKIAEDTNVEKTYTFAPPAQPSVTSLYDQDFDEKIEYPVAYFIQDGVADRLEIDGLPTISLADNIGDGIPAADIVETINTWADDGVYPYEASVVETLEGRKYIKITKTTPGATEIRMTAEDATDRERVLATYLALGFYEGQSDSSTGLSAAEAAAQINSAENVMAEPVKVLYESGDATGVTTTTTRMTLTSGTIAATDHGHIGDMLLVRSGINAGYRRITGVGVDTVDVDVTTPFKKIGATESWVILSENLKLTSIAMDLNTELIVGDGTGNSLNDVMGFADDTVAAGTTSGFRVAEDAVDVDFSHLDVVEGDVVLIAHTEGEDVIATEHEVLELASSNYQLEVSPKIGTDWTIDSFRILSAAAVAYEVLVAALAEWDALLAASEFSEDILELERVMNPLIANKNPSISQLNDAMNTLLALDNLLTNTSPNGLTEILKSFQVSLVPRIDAALKMLKERGMDRAYDLLMDGKIATFFGMDKDDASSSAYMLKSMRGVVRSDLRVSKLDDDADDTTHRGLVVGTDPDYDYSDADSDENVKLLGESAEFDSEGDTSRTSKLRY